MAITKYIKGDITKTDIANIAHGVNCMNKMGSGVAKALFLKWPEIKENYHTGFNQLGKSVWIGKLGTTQKVLCKDNKLIYNLFTQFNYGNDGKKYANYAAIAEAFKALIYEGIDELAIPKIGCGLAGGDWNIVEQIINDAVLDNINITVYYL